MSDYKFTPIIVTKDEKGNIIIDEEKLKEMLKEAYSNGFLDGQLSTNNDNKLPSIAAPAKPYNPIPYVPDIVPTTPTIPVPGPFWYNNWYCVAGDTNVSI